MSEGERVGEGDINAVWNRLHEYRDDHKDLAAEMLGDRRVGEERHLNNGALFTELKSEISSIHSLLTQQGSTLSVIADGQRSILQTMSSDQKTRIETAAALEAAEKARRSKDGDQWQTPMRIITAVFVSLAIIGYLATQLR